MKGPIDLLNKVRSIESTLSHRFDTAAKKLSKPGPREPLEIAHAIVDAVEREVQAGGGGRFTFPFNSIHVSVLAASREMRDRLDAVLAGNSGLRQRIEHKLRSAGCRPADLDVSISYAGRAQTNWRDPEFHVKFARVEAPAPAAEDTAAERPRLDMTVSRGVTDKRSYSFAGERIDLGRCGEVKNADGRLIRTNDIAFTDGADVVNQSVSRQHAHIARRPGTQEFRLYDDGSARGTYIVRHGKMVVVPRGSRGVRLESGDEIGLGDARLRIRISGASAFRRT
jgi:hypothetical protein